MTKTRETRHEWNVASLRDAERVLREMKAKAAALGYCREGHVVRLADRCLVEVAYVAMA